jgi:hypothetical protein
MTTLAIDLNADASPLIAAAEPLGSLLLTPDFSYHGDIGKLIEIVERVGAELIWSIPVALSAADISGLYEGRLTFKVKQSPGDVAWLARRQYSIGPAYYCGFRATDDAPDMQRRLERQKGHKERHRQIPDTLRAIAANSFPSFGTVHCPNDAENFIMDMRVILGEGVEPLVFQTPEALPRDVLDAIVFRAKLLKTERSLAMIPRLCALVFAVCAGDPWGSRRAAVDAMRQCLRIAHHIEALGPTEIAHAEVLGFVQELLPSMAELAARTTPLVELIRPGASPDMRRLLLRSARRAIEGRALGHRQVADVLLLLHANAVPLTLWEEQLLLSLSVYG